MRFSLCVMMLLIGCAPRYVIPPDGQYDYRVPVSSRDVGDVFETLISHTVKVTWRPTYRVVYYTHDFTSDTGARLMLPLPDPQSPTGYRLAKDGIYETQNTFAKAGAGILLARTKLGEQRDAAAVLTVSHIITGPDTIRTYLRDARGFPADILASLAIKEDEVVDVVADDGEAMSATIKAVDDERDLALLTISMPWRYESKQPFGFPLGQGKDVRWGNFAYIAGFPHGRVHVTGGTVSLDASEGRFYIDAAIRAGYSGGPVVAVRDGLPRLELIGLCCGVRTHMVRRLAPDMQIPPGTALSEALLDQIYVEEAEEEEFGLGFAVGIDDMKAFLLEQRSALAGKGIDVQNSAILKLWGF